MDAHNQVLREGLLASIHGPADLRALPATKLPQLCAEMRARILSVVSKTGGHLGGPLGAVELITALHYVYDTPRDQIVIDTGHQAYAHKLLTGRNKDFDTLRQEKGISGFCSITESEYDVFGAGHAGTSLSAALGIATARDLKGEDYNVIAVIGDAACVTGMAFEALNNIGALKPNILVVLNDNGMSISRSVGALANYLNDNRGTKNGAFFEHLGFKVFGPVDGHDTDELISALREVKDLHGPILLHVITEKGKGYAHAEEASDKGHGMSKFDVKTGKALPSASAPIAYTSAFAEALNTLAVGDRHVVAITAGMKSGTGLSSFEKQFPGRFFDVGISEQHAVTFAAGLALKGMRPVCAIYSTFLQRSYDQIVHDVALQNLPVLFAMDRAGFVGDDGATHAGIFDIAYLKMIPNMTVMVPRDEDELGHMLKTGMHINGPSSVRYPRGPGVGVRRTTPALLPVGKAEIMQRGEGTLVLALGPLVHDALKASAELGLRCTIVNVRFVKPMDSALILAEARKHRRVITLEEGVIEGGFGQSVAHLLKTNNIFVPVQTLGIKDAFIEHAKQPAQKAQTGIDFESIKRALRGA